jgi:hypothetical protein
LKDVWLVTLPPVGGSMIVGFRDHGSHFEVTFAYINILGPVIETPNVIRAMKS